MKLLLQELPASELAPKAVQETPAPDKDPLIAQGLQKEQYVGIVGIAIALIAAVGFFSRRVEYAIAFALFLSVILIALFIFI
ncbi:MAG: hypothetical protein V7K89_25205 [Nostoc sp.]|uniref:hypothetical protein n=1 Tax=Nostoc sp. TaxID=1180 RepID=UPI002FFC6B1B